MLNLAATGQGSALGSCRPGAVAAHAGLSDSFGGTNSGFGSADGCGVSGSGSGSQSVGVYLEIGLDGFFDHTTSEEFGKACAFHCSSDAGFIVGQRPLVDGGSVNVTM